MTKNDFLLRLTRHTSREEGERLYSYYAEIIDDRVEAGEDESTIIASFGDVERILQESEANLKVTEFQEKPRISTGLRAVFAVLIVFASPFVLALGLPLIVTIFALVFTLLVTLFSLVLSFGALGLGGLVAIIFGVYTLFTAPLVSLFQIGMGFIALGLGAILSYFAIKLCKLGMNAIKIMCAFFIRKIKGKRGMVQNEA